MVINHTGWGSALFENHPEWFVHDADGTFVSPGAWGVTWGDLVELNPNCVDLWDELADAFLTWCRRGRGWLPLRRRLQGAGAASGNTSRPACARNFPKRSSSWKAWAARWRPRRRCSPKAACNGPTRSCSKIYGGGEVARYLDYSLRQSERVGLYVHYSETHDNDRLAGNGRAWSLLRNRLCALASVSGRFRFHLRRRMAGPGKNQCSFQPRPGLGQPDNLLPELARLNRLLAGIPASSTAQSSTRLSADDSPVYALRRTSAEGLDTVLVLVNIDARQTHAVSIRFA